MTQQLRKQAATDCCQSSDVMGHFEAAAVGWTVQTGSSGATRNVLKLADARRTRRIAHYLLIHVLILIPSLLLGHGHHGVLHHILSHWINERLKARKASTNAHEEQ